MGKKRRHRARPSANQAPTVIPDGTVARPTPEILDPQPVMRKVQQQIGVKFETYNGPLPPPGFLNEYSKTIKDGGERVFRLIESEAQHIQSQERKILDAQIRLLGRGQIAALVVAIGALLAAAYIVQFNAIVAGMALTAGLGTLAVAFLQGRANTSSPSENKEKK